MIQSFHFLLTDKYNFFKKQLNSALNRLIKIKCIKGKEVSFNSGCAGNFK